MGFLIPSLEQCRYLREYKRQLRLEREAANAAATATTNTATTSTDNVGTSAPGNQKSTHNTTKNDTIDIQTSLPDRFTSILLCAGSKDPMILER